MQPPAPADLRLERGARRRTPSPAAGPPRAPIASLLCCQMRQSETVTTALLVMFRIVRLCIGNCYQVRTVTAAKRKQQQSRRARLLQRRERPELDVKGTAIHQDSECAPKHSSALGASSLGFGHHSKLHYAGAHSFRRRLQPLRRALSLPAHQLDNLVVALHGRPVRRLTTAPASPCKAVHLSTIAPAADTDDLDAVFYLPPLPPVNVQQPKFAAPAPAPITFL